MFERYLLLNMSCAVNVDNTVGAVGFLPTLVPTRLHPIALVKADDSGALLRGPDGYCIRCKPRQYIAAIAYYYCVKTLVTIYNLYAGPKHRPGVSSKSNTSGIRLSTNGPPNINHRWRQVVFNCPSNFVRYIKKL